MNKRKGTNGLIVLLVLGVIIMMFVMTATGGERTQSRKYSEIVSYFEQGIVDEFTLNPNSGAIEMYLDTQALEALEETGGQEEQPEQTNSLLPQLNRQSDETVTQDGRTRLVYNLPLPSLFLNRLDEYKEIWEQAHPGEVWDYDILQTTETPIWVTMLPFILLSVVVMGVFYYLMYMQAGGGKAMNVGRAKVKDQSDQGRRATFKDVAGADEEKAELEEIVEFLKDQHKFNTLGARIPHGVLLVGPPGTGKTLLAKAVAGEAGVPFFSISGSDFVEMFVGVGASRVRDLFKQAKEAAPCIVFIDEIDAVGRQRGAGLGGGHDEREQTLNQLLVEMDGFEDSSSVILVAATNRPDILDPALLRPGRFDRRVTVDRPDVGGREKILAVHAEGKPLADDVDFERLAKVTPGFTGADLANLMNEAALLAARRHLSLIGTAEVEEAMERVVAGPERKSRVITEGERRVIAYHESGHALVGHVLENSDPIHKISIVSRGQALGYTLQVPEEDHFLETRDGMLDQIAVLLAGRTAEELFCDDVTTGASNDLERATKLARTMVTRYGMSEELGAQVFGEAQHEGFRGRDYANRQASSAETAPRLDAEVERIMREGHKRARSVLEERRGQMDTMARVLLERETVEGAAVDALLADRWDEYAATEKDATAEKDAQAEKDATAEAAAGEERA